MCGRFLSDAVVRVRIASSYYYPYLESVRLKYSMPNIIAKYIKNYRVLCQMILSADWPLYIYPNATGYKSPPVSLSRYRDILQH